MYQPSRVEHAYEYALSFCLRDWQAALPYTFGAFSACPASRILPQHRNWKDSPE